MRGGGPGVCGAIGCHYETGAVVASGALLSSAGVVEHRRNTSSVRFLMHTEAFD